MDDLIADRDLIQKLESAAEGSRELDGETFFAVHPELKPAVAEYAERRCVTLMRAWEINRGSKIPHYTTSLDAKLPWENIVHVKAPGWNGAKPEGRWEVACATDEPGHAVYAYAKTEPLARRAAALRVWRRRKDEHRSRHCIGRRTGGEG